ncbi:MAG: DUF2971 domain-containing protein [Akkermansia sp.]|nr:DUF2971 domain-containing protein [Akkermansia sp.]
MVAAPTKRLYLYCTENGLLSIIDEGKLKVSQPWGTNDITEGVSQGATRRNPSVEQHGYVCFSETCTSPAMWGYYAQRSQGAVFVFDIAYTLTESCNNQWKILNPQKWQNQTHDLPGKLVKVEYGTIRPPKEADIYTLLSQKSKTWEAEREYRYILPLANCEFEDIEEKNGVTLGIYKTSSILQFATGIILGTECRLKEALIQAKLKQKEDTNHIPADITVSRIEWDNENFELVNCKFKCNTL